MDIHQLKVFASVFRNRSFSKASEELYLTQPTISDHIRSLEEDFCCKLFDRVGRTIIPTKEADALYSHAVEIIEKAHGLKDIISRLKKDAAGELIIGASTLPATYLMPALIASFQKKHPAVFFQIIVVDSREVVDRVSRHELLLGIAGSKLTNPQVNFIPFMDDELIVISPPSLIEKTDIKLGELIKFPMILREEGSGTRKESERILENKGVCPDSIKVAGIFGSTDAVKEAVKAGLGISIVSRLSVRDELKIGSIKEVKLAGIEMKRKFYLVTHKKRTLPLSYNLCLEHIKNESKNI